MAASEAEPAPGRETATEIIVATGAVLAEAQEAGRDARAAAGGRDGAGTAALLQSRLQRLASAASDAITAAGQDDQELSGAAIRPQAQ